MVVSLSKPKLNKTARKLPKCSATGSGISFSDLKAKMNERYEKNAKNPVSKKPVIIEEGNEVTLRVKERKKKLIKDNQLVSPQKKLATATLVLKNLPPTIDYAQLKGVIPNAQRLELYKKNGKRHAFARFATTENCSHTASKLQGLKISGHEVRVAFASHSKSKQSHSMDPHVDDSCSLHLSNLPFTITQQKLEEEFPNSSRIVMNINAHGRFRGSCLLEFDSVEDCRIAREACRGRQIDGRPVRCRPGTGFKIKDQMINPKSKDRQIFSIKAKGIPVTVTDGELHAMFEKCQLIGLYSSVDSCGTTKTVVYKFKSKEDQNVALNKFRGETLFGVRVHAKPWKPPARQRGKKKEKVVAHGEKQLHQTLSPSNSKKMNLTDPDRELAESSVTPKRKKLKKQGDSLLNTSDVAEASMNSEKKRKSTGVL